MATFNTFTVLGDPESIDIAAAAELANGQAAESAERIVGEVADEIVQVAVNAADSGLADDPYVDVFVLARIGDDPATADNGLWIGRIKVASGGGVARLNPLALAQVFGGVLPTAYKLRLFNATGAALEATGHSVVVRPATVETRKV